MMLSTGPKNRGTNNMVDEVKDAGTGGQAAAGGGNAESSVPENLKKFAGADGKIDLAKLSQSVSEADKKATQDAQKRADAERAYAMAVAGFGAMPGAGSPGAGGVDGRGSDEGLDAEGDEPVTARDAKPIVTSLLVLTHPELAVDERGEPVNPKFYDGLFKYMRGLPASMKAALKSGDFQTVEWAVREYKALSKTSASGGGGGVGGARPNFVEGGSPGGGTPAGTTYSRADIRKMMRDNPDDYAKISADYGKAMDEGRVKE
jgi:hypothetical protein